MQLSLGEFSFCTGSAEVGCNGICWGLLPVRRRGEPGCGGTGWRLGSSGGLPGQSEGTCGWGWGLRRAGGPKGHFGLGGELETACRVTDAPKIRAEAAYEHHVLPGGKWAAAGPRCGSHTQLPAEPTLGLGPLCLRAAGAGEDCSIIEHAARGDSTGSRPVAALTARGSSHGDAIALLSEHLGSL